MEDPQPHGEGSVDSAQPREVASDQVTDRGTPGVPVPGIVERSGSLPTSVGCLNDVAQIAQIWTLREKQGSDVPRSLANRTVPVPHGVFCGAKRCGVWCERAAG